MRYFVTIEDEVLEVEVGEDGLTVDGEPVDARLLEATGSELRALRVGHGSVAVLPGTKRGDVRTLHLDGRPVEVAVVDERTQRVREMSGAAGGHGGPKPIKAPMPGLVVRVDVAPGDTVEPGQGVIIVEAMKMENELRADVAGVVAHVLVEAGQAVEKDQVLLDFEAPAAEDEE